jgi:hypothetical protein
MFSRRNVLYSVVTVVGVGLIGYGIRRFWFRNKNQE